MNERHPLHHFLSAAAAGGPESGIVSVRTPDAVYVGTVISVRDGLVSLECLDNRGTPAAYVLHFPLSVVLSARFADLEDAPEPWTDNGPR